MNKFLSDFISRLNASTVVKSFLVLFSSSIVSQAITIVSTLLLARLYSPEDFGVFSVYSASVGIVVIFTTLRLDIAMITAEDEIETVAIFSIVLRSLIAFSISLFALAFFFPNLPAALLGSQPQSLLYLIVIGSFFLGLNNAMVFLLNKHKDYRLISLTRILIAAVTAMVGIVSGFFWNSTYNLIFAHILAYAGISALLFFRPFVLETFKKATTVPSHLIGETFRKNKRYVLYSMPTTLLDTFSMQLPIFVISNLFSPVLLGQYSFAFRLINLPLTLVTANLGQIFFQEFSDRHAVEMRQAKRLLFKTWRNLFLIGILPFTVLFIFGEDIFSLFFGDEWSTAGKICRIMAPLLFLMFISSPTSNAYLTLGKQRIAFMFGVGLLIFRGVALWLGHLQGSFFYGILYYVIAESALILLYNLLLLNFLKLK